MAERLKFVLEATGLNYEAHLYTEPIILPLNAEGKLYALEDEHGRIVGTGTREICEVLLTIMRSHAFNLRTLPSAESGRQAPE